MNIRDLILDPDKFFRELSNREPSLLTPFLIVLTLSVLNTIYAYYKFSVMASFFPPDMQELLSIFLVFALLTSFLGGFIGWVLVAGIMHLVSILFKGKGPFKRTLEFIGKEAVTNKLQGPLKRTLPLKQYRNQVHYPGYQHPSYKST